MNQMLLPAVLVATLAVAGVSRELAVSVSTTANSTEDLESLKSRFRDSKPRERREAVKGLIQLDSLEAWDLVIDGLADPVGEVADEAQLGLSELPDDLHEELFGKRGLQSKREIVPLRVAEVFGRMNVTFTDKQYAKGLGHKDAEVRRSLLWSLERLAQREKLLNPSKDLIKAVRKLAQKDKDDLVQAQALVAMAVLDKTEATGLAMDFLAAKAAVKRTAALELVGFLPAMAQIPILRAAITDPAFSVRLSAYDSAAKLGSMSSMAVLVDALEKEEQARPAWRIVEHLRGCTGMKYGRDFRPWRDWLAKQPEGWTAKTESVDGDSGDEGTTALVGMRVISTRVAFLIDFSGSMWEEKNGRSLKQRVDVEMRKTLEGLHPDVSFNVEPYATDPILWEKELKPASERNVKQAIEFFESCTLQGKGDFWKAMQLAMLDEEVDTFMLLGDGAPSGGPRWNMRLMKSLFGHENRFRRITLDALLVEPSGFLLDQWTTISKESGGRCIDVEL